ncbi:hypothetical protein ACXR0O_11340 [Verrucomicrobiota bacterium sgz303538]
MQQILRNIKDVPGVIGSFVLSSDGGLVDKEMPAFVGTDIFADLGRRLTLAFGTLDTVVGEFDDLLLKFDEQWLYSRRLSNGVLSILSAATVNFPALRMATNIAATKVESLIPAALAQPSQASAPIPVATPPATPTPSPAPKRFWRGQVVD